MTHIAFFKGGKSYEELKEELGDVTSPVIVTTVCSLWKMLLFIMHIWNKVPLLGIQGYFWAQQKAQNIIIKN